MQYTYTVNGEGRFWTGRTKIIFFSSDRKGGLGGYDLYAAQFTDSNSLEKITNLGKRINTEFDEVAPYYNALGQKLVFANNGRIGMGNCAYSAYLYFGGDVGA